MKIVYPVFGCLLFIFFSCGSSKPRTNLEDIQALKKIIESKHFFIESDMAYPRVTNAVQQVLNTFALQTGGNASSINLIGNPNFLKISGDNISSYLPYFGERQMGVGINSDSAIELHGVMEDYHVEKSKNESYLITFNARSKEEFYNVLIKVFPNLKCELMLNGSTRLGIRYSGDLNKNPVDENKNN